MLVHHNGLQSTSVCLGVQCVCVCVFDKSGEKRGLVDGLLFIGSVLLSYLYHSVPSVTQSGRGKRKIYRSTVCITCYNILCVRLL